MQTLEDLKRENAEKESAELEAPQVTEETEETEAASTTEDEPEPEQAEQDEGETEEVEVESWMEAEEQASEDSDTFTAKDIAGLRRKMKGKIKGKDEENERLHQEIELLKSSNVAPSQGPSIKRPNLDDYTTTEDYEAAYESYLLARVENNNSKAQQEQAYKARESEHKRKIDTDVEAHYQRASEMVKTHSIKPERFKQADETVRSAMDEVRPGQGDLVVDHMLSLLGEGSEKVGYYLGNNLQALNELKLRMMNDKAGHAAMAYLGELKAKVTMPAKAKRKVAKPATQLSGDNSTSEAASLKSLKATYNKAKPGSDEAFSARMAYRKAGGNTSEL